jgi:hypothetical protein
MSLKHAFGTAALNLIEGGSVPAGSDDPVSMHKNIAWLTARNVAKYGCLPISSDHTDDDFIAMTVKLAECLKLSGGLYFESPDSVVYLASFATDGTCIVPELSYNHADHVIEGLSSPKSLTYKMLSTPTDRKAIADAIRCGQFKFLRVANVGALTVLGKIPVTLPISGHISSGDESVREVRSRLETLLSRVSCCLRCTTKELSCSAHCASCSSSRSICSTCLQLGYKHYDNLLRPCRNCITARSKCVRLESIFLSMDSCGTQLKVQKDFTSAADTQRQQEQLSADREQLPPLIDQPPPLIDRDELQNDEEVVEEASGDLIEENRIKTIDVLPMGEGPHNLKSFLLNSRNHIFWRRGDKGPLYLISLSMIQQLAFSDNLDIAEKIRFHLAPRFLEMIDRQDPLNATYYSNPDLISVIVILFRCEKN